MCDPQEWARIREQALEGWQLCSDGRLYHPVVAEKALEAWIENLARRKSSGAGNAERWGVDFDHAEIDRSTGIAERCLRRSTRNPAPFASDRRRRPPQLPGMPIGVPPGIPVAIPSGIPMAIPNASRCHRKRQGQRQGQGYYIPYLEIRALPRSLNALRAVPPHLTHAHVSSARGG
jgi:hypothetical protein